MIRKSYLALSGSAAAILPSKLTLYLKDVELSFMLNYVELHLHYYLVVHLVYIDKV